MTAIDEIVYVLEEAFSGAGIEESNEGQSLMQNLLSVEGSMWLAVPAGGVRTIESIAVHVGMLQGHVRRVRVRTGAAVVGRSERAAVGAR